ncbi:hypothetical protein [Haliangium sp.]|uniref:hypothetical protein n=1 Tax=Haliangium sp. TaxID=2663208 RepID=UPI003D0FEA8A
MCDYKMQLRNRFARWQLNNFDQNRVKAIYNMVVSAGGDLTRQPYNWAGTTWRSFWSFVDFLRVLGAKGLLNNWNLNAFNNDQPRVLWLNRLSFALSSSIQYVATAIDPLQQIRISELLTVQPQRLRQLTNLIWAEALEPINGNDLRTAAQMYDPSPMTERHKMSLVTDSVENRAFHHSGVLFRADTRPWTSPDGNCVKTHGGFKAKWEVSAGPLQTTYDLTRQTLPSTGMMINRQNSDFFNETGVCLARTVEGSTCFPALDYYDDSYIYAIDVTSTHRSRLLGFDTEALQISLVMTPNQPRLDALWRYGEKAYREVSHLRVIAWRKLTRTWDNVAGASGSQPLFKYKLGKWHFVNPLIYKVNDPRVKYVKKCPRRWQPGKEFTFKYDQRWRLANAPLPTDRSLYHLKRDLKSTHIAL